MDFNNFNLVTFILLVRKWKKFLLTVTIAALLVSTVVALLLPNYYRSTVKFYPYTIKASDPRLAFSSRDYEIIGEDEDFERVLSIATSRRMNEFLTEKFDLFNHYDIDREKERYPYTKLAEELKDNYKIKKTEKGIEITVEDKDPEFASEMANTIVHQIEKINSELITERNVNMSELYKSFLNDSRKQISMINDSIIKLRAGYSIDDFTKENSLLAYNKRNAKIKPTDVSSSDEYMSLKKNFELIKNFDTQMQELSKELAAYELMYNQAVSSLEKPFKTLLIIEEATPSEKKAKPFRSLIILLSTLGALILVLLGIMCVEYYQKEIKQALAK
ncbi:hypothetical protein RCC89_15245 [Cytophagaceae bacterium ABcell3]|nr:hypothetical protein RCC89_15245 [Cytophagaceae bacterium ABcell3]